jgi:hypothetical protein
MNITPIAKNELRELSKNCGLAMVMLACDISTEENKNGFLEEFANFLAEEGATLNGKKTADTLFSEVRVYENTSARPRRTDLIYVVKDGAFNMGRLPVVRMKMGSQLKWFDDYLDNGLHNR